MFNDHPRDQGEADWFVVALVLVPVLLDVRNDICFTLWALLLIAPVIPSSQEQSSQSFENQSAPSTLVRVFHQDPWTHGACLSIP